MVKTYSLQFLFLDVLAHLLKINEFVWSKTPPVFIVSYLDYVAIHGLVFLGFLTIDVWRLENQNL